VSFAIKKQLKTTFFNCKNWLQAIIFYSECKNKSNLPSENLATTTMTTTYNPLATT
jgi:hypothetical protein